MAGDAASAAFVAGATGYVGREVVRLLAARGIRTLAHVRPDSPALARWRERFAALGAEADATPWEPDAMRATLAGLRPTLVFALLGTTRARARRAAEAGRAETYEAIDYGLTALLLEAVRRAAPGARFVYLSSVGAGGRAAGDYLRVRKRLESELRASGVPYTIARPAFITGPDRDERRVAERLAAGVVDGALDVAGLLGLGHVRERWRSTTASELAGALVRLGLDPAAAGAVVEGKGLRSG